MTLMSDRDKGLMNTQEVVYGNTITSLICCFHLKGMRSYYILHVIYTNSHISIIGNLCKRYNNTLAPYFWTIANTISVEAYRYEMDKLAQVNPGAAQYLQQIDPKQ